MTSLLTLLISMLSYDAGSRKGKSKYFPLASLTVTIVSLIWFHNADAVIYALTDANVKLTSWVCGPVMYCH